MGWGARLLVALVLMLAGAAAAVWSLGHYRPAARFLGIAAEPAPVMLTPKPVVLNPPAAQPQPTAPAADERLTTLEQRLSQVENATQRAEGSAGRADALVVAFAARRAIDRGIALGYLENLLVGRFGRDHQQAVATIVTASHQPVRLDDLAAEYDGLGDALRRDGPREGWWSGFRRELGDLVQVRHATRPAPSADARYARAQQRLAAGQVDQALAETMRMPGAAQASDWVDKARRYVAVHRALDEIESAALLGAPNPPA
jgi:hypothetical protein